MSQDWKWRVGIDTEQASKAFDDLAKMSQEADDSLQGVVQVLQVLEQHLANLNQIGAAGLGALAEIGDRISTGFAGVDTKLTGVLGKLTRLISISSEAAQTTSSTWGQGASAVERYAERVAEASVNIASLQQRVQQLGAVTPTAYGLTTESGQKLSDLGGEKLEKKTLEELYPDLETYERAVADLQSAHIDFTQTSVEGLLEVQRAMSTTAPEADKYAAALRDLGTEEAKLLRLTELEKRAREQVAEAVAQQASAEAQRSAATPEGKLSTFFTTPQATEWTSKFGLGEMTGFEQSLLKVLTMFDQLREVGADTKITFADIIQTIEHLGAIRLQPLGTSIRTNIRTRLEEGTAAAQVMIQTLEELNAVQMGDKGVGVSSGEAAPSKRMVAPVETKTVVAEVETMSKEISQAFDEAPQGAEKAAGRIESIFKWLRKRVSGDSIVPDMVREVNFWLSQMGREGSLQGIQSIGQKFLEVQREMQKIMLMGEGGLPGFGTSGARAEILFNLGLRKDALQILQQDIGQVLEQASVGQWQNLRAPTGQTVPVPPAFVQELSAQETEKHKRQVEGLTSSEEELSDAAMRTARSLWEQAKASRTKVDILKDLQKGTISAAQADEELAKMNKNVQGEIEKTNVLASRFVRHIAWIFQGIVIWGAIRAMQDWVGKFNEGFTEIEMQAAHAAFIVESSTERMMDAQRSYAGMVTQYGVGPAEAAPVLPLAERYGMADPRIAELSAQLSMVSDEEMSMADAANYLMSVMRQWNMTIDESSRVMDTLATMYAHVPGTMAGFLDLMREGPALAEQMGQSFEENMLLISRAMSFLPGRTATTVSGTMGRILSRVYRQDAARKLAQEYGISVYDPETLGRKPGLEVLDEIAQKFRVIKSESEKAALAEMVAGARQGQAWKDAYVMLENWTDGIRDAQTEMVEMDALVDKVADTHKTALDEMSASWELYIQKVGQSTGLIKLFDDAIRSLSDSMQRAAREQDILFRAEELGLDIRERERVYATSTGLDVREPKAGGTMPGRTEEFLDWMEEFISRLEGAGRGPVPTARERGWDPSAIRESSRTFAQLVEKAGQDFNNEIKDSADTMRKSLLVAMVATGWTPGTGVVDLSDYSTAQINQAMQKSTADTNRMINAYRRFLQDEGFGGEAIEDAMQEFTNKLMLQLQFFRLPGNQIRLMEGRDLLFYLSQIEENTRPLEGIWNVPEGMRVWVPIESTFYGDWRERQGAEEEGGTVLDSSAFDASAAAFGVHVDEFGVLGRSVWQNMKERLPTQDEGGTLWDARMRDFFTWMEFLRTGPTIDPEQPWMGYAGAGERSGLDLDRLGQSADKYVAATESFAVGVYNLWGKWEPAGGAGGPSGPNVGGGAMPRPRPEGEPYDLYLPLIMKAIEMSTGPTIQEIAVDIPEPLDVSLRHSQIAQGVAVGTIQTGMPIAMSSLAMATSAMAGAISSQIYYLMLIAGNTAQAPTTIVYANGGTTPTTGGGGGEPYSNPPLLTSLMTDWNLTHGTGIVPT